MVVAMTCDHGGAASPLAGAAGRSGRAGTLGGADPAGGPGGPDPAGGVGGSGGSGGLALGRPGSTRLGLILAGRLLCRPLPD
jgi:hypothetical protein